MRLDGSPITPQQTQQLIDMLKQAGGTLYLAAQEQVRASAWFSIFLGTVFLVVTVIAVIAAIKGFNLGTLNSDPGVHEELETKRQRIHSESKGWLIFIVSCAVTLAGFSSSLHFLTDAYFYFMAPDYATIQVLTQLIPGG